MNFSTMNDDKFLQMIKKQYLFGDPVRFYFICKTMHYFINDGHIKSGFSPKIMMTKNRDSVLSAFSKMGFLFDEMIRMCIVEPGKSSDELLYVLNLIPMNRKIRTFFWIGESFLLNTHEKCLGYLRCEMQWVMPSQ